MRYSVYAIVLTAILSVGPFFSADAQNYFNLKIGTSLYSQTNSGGSPIVGFIGGLSYEPKLANKIWLEVGARYVDKGTRIGTVANVTQFTTRLRYVDIPVYVKYTYEVRNFFTWAVYGGPSIGIATGARNRFFSIGQPVVLDIPIGGTGGLNPTDFAANLGGELNFKTGYGYVSLFTEFQYGLSTVLSDLAGNSLNNIGLNIGLKLKLGKRTEIEEAPIDLNRL